MKRIGIFFFYDPQGIVDRYVDIMLEAFKPFIEKLVVVVNGRLNRNGRLLFKKYADNVMVRQNTDFDVGAYKYALEYIGWEEICKYNELVMFNHTIFAPIFPLNEMFETMEKQDDIDFWGITKCHQFADVPQRLKSHLKTPFMPEHINSHFIAVRREIFREAAFREHFEKMPEIKTYEDSNYFHEILFTQKFSNFGYNWAVYAESDFLKKSVVNPLIDAPLEMLSKTCCPILKRKNFFGNFESYLHKNAANNTVRLLDYLKTYTDYDTDLIYENMIRTCSMGELQKFFPLRCIVSEQPASNTEMRIGVIISAGSRNIVDKHTDTLRSFSGFSNAKVFLVADNDVVETISEIKKNVCGRSSTPPTPHS